MEINEIVAIAAGVAYILAYLDYFKKILNGKTNPNGATWLIWSVIATVSTTSYVKMSGDVWKSIIPLINIFLCIAVFVVGLYLKKFERPDATDFAALILGVIAAVVWKIFGSAKYANLIVQFAVIAGFVPLWRALWKRKSDEQPRPWWIWTVSYILSAIVVCLRWQDNWYELLYPANCIVLHSSIPILRKLWCKPQLQPTERVTV